MSAYRAADLPKVAGKTGNCQKEVAGKTGNCQKDTKPNLDLTDGCSS